MGESKGDVTIGYQNSRPSWSPDPPTTVELNCTDWFEVKGVSWPAELKITAIQFFEGTSETREKLIGEWKTGDPAGTVISKQVDGQPVNCFKVTGSSASDVKIEDVEDSNSVDDTFSYKVHVQRTDGSGEWWLDPQVINRRKGDS
jgi:hypothetical protein